MWPDNPVHMLPLQGLLLLVETHSINILKKHPSKNPRWGFIF